MPHARDVVLAVKHRPESIHADRGANPQPCISIRPCGPAQKAPRHPPKLTFRKVLRLLTGGRGAMYDLLNAIANYA
jgi:hypothetical protein